MTFIFTTVYITNKYNNTSEENKTISSVFGGSSKDEQLSKNIKYIKSILDKYYLNDIDEEKAAEGAIEGYVASLGDPYTEYIPKDEMGRLYCKFNGKLCWSGNIHGTKY